MIINENNEKYCFLLFIINKTIVVNYLRVSNDSTCDVYLIN